MSRRALGVVAVTIRSSSFCPYQAAVLYGFALYAACSGGIPLYAVSLPPCYFDEKPPAYQDCRWGKQSDLGFDIVGVNGGTPVKNG